MNVPSTTYGSPAASDRRRRHPHGEFDFDLGFWTPMALDNADYFVCGSSILLHGTWVGLLMHTDRFGTFQWT